MIELLKNRTSHFINDTDFKTEVSVIDENYKAFLKEFNGGFFFNNALHIYGTSNKFKYHDLIEMNNLFKVEYGDIVDGLFFFAEDVFGNAFVFDEIDTIYLFNIETGEKEFISKGFSTWLDVVKNDTDYLTGMSFTDEISNEDIIKLSKGMRLGAKYPFVLGGNYSIDNLTLKNFKENIGYNSSIAKQIYDLPDGTSLKLDIE